MFIITLPLSDTGKFDARFCFTKGWIAVVAVGRFDFLLVREVVLPADVSAYEYPLLRLDLLAEEKLLLTGVFASNLAIFGTVVNFAVA